MKQKLITLIMLALTYFTVEGQITFTPEIGLSFSNYRFDETLDEWYDSNTKVRYVFGASFDIPLVGGLYFQPRIYYTQKGSLIDSESNQPWYEEVVDGELVSLFDNYEEEVNYLEFPVMLKYQFLGGSYGFHIAAGPSFALGLNGTSRMTLTDNNDLEEGAGFGASYNEIFEIEDETNIDFGAASGDTYESFEVGIAAAFGMYYETEIGQWIFELRYIRGLTDMYGDDYAADIIQYNNNLYLSVGYAIPITGGY